MNNTDSTSIAVTENMLYFKDDDDDIIFMFEVYTEEGIIIVTTYVIIKLIIPCINFNMIYRSILISVFPTKEVT